MHILNNRSPHIIRVIPRSIAEGQNYTIVITDEQMNETVTIESSEHSTVGNYEVIQFEHTFKTIESFHSFVIKIEAVEVYRGIMYLTGQTDFDRYSVNQGQYTSYAKANANEYITI